MQVETGRFITLEGGEGAGKSTQAKLLADWLRERAIETEITREPGGSPGAEEIRKLLVTGEVGRWDSLTETLLHYAARRDHMTSRIMPALSSGRWVISDRFYQGYGQGVDLDVIGRLRALTIGAFKPDLTIILDVAPETRRARVSGRPGGEDRYERMTEAFHARVRNGFKVIASSEPERCVTVDADLSIAEVAAAIQGAVAQRLGFRAG
jgi:dTMP kinase